MQYTDTNEYLRRILMLEEVMQLHPEVMKAVTDPDRQLLQRYFLSAAESDDVTEYRRQVIKSDARVEVQANKAYERFMAEAGMSETLLPVR
jgi:hypothetical protein